MEKTGNHGRAVEGDLFANEDFGCAASVEKQAQYDFGDLFKKETGKTAQEYIRNHLIDTAKELIAGTDKSITQIAYDLGFQYSQHFNRVFKKSVGYTPVEYRRMIG